MNDPTDEGGYVFVRWRKGATGTWLNYQFYSIDHGFVDDADRATFVSYGEVYTWFNVKFNVESVFYYSFVRCIRQEKVKRVTVLQPDFNKRF